MSTLFCALQPHRHQHFASRTASRRLIRVRAPRYWGGGEVTDNPSS